MHGYRFYPLIFAGMLAASVSAFAEVRSWKTAAGTSSFKASFVKRDASSVTLRGENGKELTFELSKLHPDESRWLDLHQPLADSSAVFDTLTFADTRETALAKLKASKIVEMTADETFLGRSGMNGAFRTRQKIGALSAMLYFDWNEAGKLKELTIQTEDQPDSAYVSALEPSWTAFIELLSSLYGAPVQSSEFPPLKNLADGSFLPSHLWKLERGGSVLLGTTKAGNTCQVCVRFSKQSKQVTELP